MWKTGQAVYQPRSQPPNELLSRSEAKINQNGAKFLKAGAKSRHKGKSRHEKCTTTYSHLSSPEITKPPKSKATDPPRWDWTNTQCREWLTEVLVYYCNQTRRVAAGNAKACMAGGFGPTLFKHSHNLWVKRLGQGPGASIYARIRGLRAKGNLPEHFTYRYI